MDRTVLKLKDAPEMDFGSVVLMLLLHKLLPGLRLLDYCEAWLVSLLINNLGQEA